MSERADGDLLADMQESVRRINVYVSGLVYEDFLTNIKTQDAVIRNIEIMGESAKCISVHLREKYPDVPWKGMAGLRDRLIHHYFGVNLDIVWNIIKTELPELDFHLSRMMQNEAFGG